MQSLVWTPDMRWPNIFWMKTLEERNRVMETERKRKMLAQLFCGEADINWGSLRQRSRQMENTGSKHPLNT